MGEAGLTAEFSLERMRGGGNNRVFRLSCSDGKLALLKAYFSAPTDCRDRFEHEHAFYRHLERSGIFQTPKALGWDAEMRVGLFEFVTGPKLSPGEVAACHVSECARFFSTLNRARRESTATDLPLASEACFSLRDHAQTIGKRVHRLLRLEAEPEACPDALELIRARLLPLWKQVREALESTEGSSALLAAPLRCLSPSDFGFHNAICSPRGLLFFDFEYAGWDDPAKMACDFFCQPDIPAPPHTLAQFLEETRLPEWHADAYTARVQALLPAYRIKWACIILNVFLKDASLRRAFADSDLLAEPARRAQLAKARLQLDAVVPA
jgi:hypothetical protein